MRYNFTPIIFYLFLLLAVNSNGQESFDSYDKRIETFSMNEGLSSSMIKSICQDKNGLIWIGTLNGLNKYDGYAFKKFHYEIDDSASLNNSFIKDLFPDGSNLWIATWGGGINIFDFEKHTFRDFSKELKANSINIQDHVEFIHQAKDGSYWFATFGGLWHYFPESKKCDHFITQPNDTSSLSANYMIEVLEKADGTMLFAGNDGRLNVFNPDKKNFKRFEIRKKSRKNDLIQITKLFEDSEQRLWVGTTDGVYSFDQNTGSFSSLITDEMNEKVFLDNQVNAILEYGDGLFWVGTSKKGIIPLERSPDNEKQIFLSDFPAILPDYEITELFKDIQGNIWICTDHSGLKVHYNKNKPFSYIESPNLLVKAIAIDSSDNIWYGTNNGLYFKEKNSKERKKYDVNLGLSSNNIRSLYNEPDRLLIGTENGLNILEKSTGNIILLREEDNLLNTSIVSIKKDQEGNYWMGSASEGLILMDGKSGEISNYEASPNIPLIGNNNVTSLCFEDNNKLWVGIYRGGLNLFDIKKRKFIKRYLNNPTDTNSINDNDVRSIYMGKNDDLWIGTENGGLNYFNNKKSYFKAYLKKDGLPSNTIYATIADSAGNLWINTHNGLAKLTLFDKTIRYYDNSDGLLTNKFMPGTIVKDSKGLIYSGTDKGIVYYDPEKIKENTLPPILSFTDFKINNSKVDFNKDQSPLKKHISYTDSIVLKHNQNAITIEYVGLNYISSNKNRYAYRLEGLEENWQSVGNQRIVNYSNLPPGEYTFMVKACNNDGFWTPEPLTLDIKVLPHPLRSNLAFSIYFVLLLLLIVFIIRIIKRLAERKHQVDVARIERDKEKQLVQFKLKFFTDISHELRTHLTLIVSPVNKLLNKGSRSNQDKKLLDRIDLNVTRLLKLTDELIDFRKVEQGKTSLRLQKRDIVSYLREIETMFVSIAEENQINFQFEIDQPELIWCFDEEKLNKILFNLLTNAFKYTHNGGWVKLSVRKTNDQAIRIAVEDNGLGIEEEHLPYVFDRFFNPGKNQQLRGSTDSSGIGLALVKQLVELHSGNIFVESKPGKGSHFYFDLPNLECKDNEVAVANNRNVSGSYHRWEEILQLERNNIQNELIITKGEMSDEVPSILIVDDNKEICLTLCSLFENKYKVFVANHGKGAMEIADKKNIDIVVSDIMMPVMDGIELCKKLKSDIKTSHIPVVLITAKTGIENELLGLRTGADAYIAKPFNDEKVLLTIENILNNRKKNQLFDEWTNSEKVNEKVYNPLDKKLIDKIIIIINQRMSDTSFNIEELGNEVGLSRVHLFRKIKAITGESPSDFVKKIRLQKGKALLVQGELSISDIAYDIGFSSSGNFSTAFKKFYGKTPVQYRAKHFNTNL